MQHTTRIGIYPGTFDPLHEGHLQFALTAITSAHLDEVILLPERKPRNKPDATDLDTRIIRISRGIAQYPQLQVRALKADVQTYKAEREDLSDLFAQAQMVLLVGTDVLRTMKYWEDADRLLRSHELCIGLRDNETAETILGTISELENIAHQKLTYSIVETPHKSLSSSLLRSAKL